MAEGPPGGRTYAPVRACVDYPTYVLALGKTGLGPKGRTMEISVAVLADAANVSGDDKLNILGVFDTVNAGEFPAVYPLMALAIRFRIDFSEAKKSHKIEILFFDEDHKGGTIAEGTIKVGPIPPGEWGHVNHVFNLAGVTFDRPGSYFIEAKWNGVVKATIPIKVSKIQG